MGRFLHRQGDLWVAVDGKKLISISNAEVTDGGEIRFYGLNTSALCEVTPVSLIEYDEALANEGIGELVEEVENDKPVLKPMADLTSKVAENNGPSVWLIVIIISAVVLVTAAVVVVVIFFKKKKQFLKYRTRSKTLRFRQHNFLIFGYERYRISR